MRKNPFFRVSRNCLLFAAGIMGVLLILGLVILGILYVISPDPVSSDTYEFTIIAEGFDQPVGIVNAGDERLFVFLRKGIIYILEDGNRIEEPFLDIQTTVFKEKHVEQGLLSLAFEPNYAETGKFYIYYTAADNSVIIARYRVSDDDPNQADPNSAEILLTIEQAGIAHNGGQLQFGPDGYLYIGVGDSTDGVDPSGTGLHLDDVLGKLLRIDVSGESSYTIPPDNPFVDTPDARPEIWNIGLRNPWRFSFDRETGDMYIGDVGEATVEEVNFQEAGSPGGLNYGWSYYEGEKVFNPSEANNPELPREDVSFPIASYKHNYTEPTEIISEGYWRCAVIGGYVYRGTELPDLQGTYIYADWCTGLMWTLKRDDDGWNNKQFMHLGTNVSSFSEDIHGELYATTFVEGTVLKLVEKKDQD